MATDRLPVLNVFLKLTALTDSGKDPNFPKSDEIEPPGTNSNNIFNDPASLAVPKYL